MNTILVYGWYNKGNLGDELFKQAFKKLIPNYNLFFTDKITKKSLENISIIIFGGGSFLYSDPNIDQDAFESLYEKKILYIGVGFETQISKVHEELIKKAEFVAIRTPNFLNKALKLNKNSIFIPDIVYKLSDDLTKDSVKIKKSILVIPNFSVVPQWDDENWKCTAWEYFKSEFSQFLDGLVEKNYDVNFLPMCENRECNDNFAAVEIINKMKNREKCYIIDNTYVSDTTKLISRYEFVITERFHGAILADIIKTPYLIISHSDKLNDINPKYTISYYESSKRNLEKSFTNMKNKYEFTKKSLNSSFELLEHQLSHILK
jgi:polysaccharide pyruvyl transferase WcaK-like protein